MLKKILWCFIFCVAAWIAGLLWFASLIPLEPPSSIPTADAIVVLTGGSKRLAYGLELLSEGKGKKLYITGVSNGVSLNALLRSAETDVHHPLPAVPRESIAIDYQARNTIGNAVQTAQWLNAQRYRSILLVTTNYHLPRSLVEFRETAPSLIIYPVPVFSNEFQLDQWRTSRETRILLLLEYHKFLAANLRHWLIEALHRT